MDESFSVAGSKFPEGEPNNEWTVEELLHYSLDQYRSEAIERTSQGIASLRNQCEKECEDVMTLHSMAVDMANKSSNNDAGADEENVNPQSENNNTATETATDKNCAKSAAPAVAGIKPASSSSTIEIQVIVGPHTSSKYLLRPKPGAPCLVGRSKGKKFIKNGISLHKDQEISTTHGKFVMEGGGLASFSSSSEGGEATATGGMATTTTGPKFYFIDVGSTNGTVYNGEPLKPNERLLLHNGMELKVGNSVLKIVFG